MNKWDLPPPTFDENLLPHQLFERFISNEELERICDESTRYARQKGNHNFIMTKRKLKAFLAIIIVSGYASLPRQDMYWQTRDDTNNRLVSSMMSRGEFEECKRYLHLCDNDHLDKNDKFSKVRPLFDSLNKQCLENYIPEQHVSVDESMVPYFGKHGAKQYIHGKPIKFGYKMWVMAKPLGYCIQFRPYAGKDAAFTEYGDIGLGLGAAVVAHLLKMLPPHPGSNYHAVMDNFFTSTKLIRYLQLKSISATGTVRLCRMENPPLKDVKMMEKEARGASDVAVDANINMAAVRWKDNKVVNVLSTFAGKDPVQKVKRYSQEAKKRIDIPQPKVVHVYNRYMGGVDRLDQNLAAYMINLRSKKWWWPLFRFCIDVAINNAYQLYRIKQLNEGESRMDALEFRRVIVETYYKNYKTKNDSVALYPKSATKNHVRMAEENHHWIRKGTQRCCAKNGCKGTSKFFCIKCNVGLHPKCFESFHFE